MRPGSFSEAGFLGPRERLNDVLAADARMLDDLGVSAQALAEQLGQILEAGVASESSSSRVKRYNVHIRRYKGPQICPFAPEPHENPCPGPGIGRLASIDWKVRNTRNSVELSGPGLIVHLIASHGFFEGLESPYRVAPDALAKLLELGSFSPAI